MTTDIRPGADILTRYQHGAGLYARRIRKEKGSRTPGSKKRSDTCQLSPIGGMPRKFFMYSRAPKRNPVAWDAWVAHCKKDGSGQPLPPLVKGAGLHFLRRRAAERFGGYTLTNCAGGWINGTGELVEEGVIRLDLYTRAARKQIEKYARDCMRELHQASVVLEIEYSNANILDAYENDNPKAA